MHFALACSHFPENSYLLANWPFCASFSYGSNSLNFEAKINCNTPRQNDLKWRKRCTGLKFDLVHFDGPQTKFIFDSLYKHPVHPKNNFGSHPSTAEIEMYVFELKNFQPFSCLCRQDVVTQSHICIILPSFQILDVLKNH